MKKQPSIRSSLNPLILLHPSLFIQRASEKRKKICGTKATSDRAENNIDSYSTASITRGNNAYTHACSASTPGTHMGCSASAPGTHMHALTPLRSSTVHGEKIVDLIAVTTP